MVIQKCVSSAPLVFAKEMDGALVLLRGVNSAFGLGRAMGRGFVATGTRENQSSLPDSSLNRWPGSLASDLKMTSAP